MSEVQTLVLDPSQMKPAMNPILVIDGAGLDRMSAYLAKLANSPQPFFGWDTETNIEPNFLEQKLRTIQVGARDEQYCIDLLAFAETEENMVRYQGHRTTAKCFEPIVNALRPFIDSNCLLKIGHRLQFEYEMCSWNLGLYGWNLWCTLMAERVRWAGLQPFKRKGFWAMEHLIERYLKLRLPENSERLQVSFDLKTPLTEEQVMYACLDTRMPIGVYLAQRQIAEREALLQTMTVENDYIPANGDMHVNGFKLYQEGWMKLVEGQKARHTEHVRRMDTHFIPIVGKKSAPAENLAELEARWRALSIRGPEEQNYHEMAKQAGQTAQEKKQWREKRDLLEARRLSERQEAKAAYMDASKYASWFRKEADKMEGEACIAYGSPAQILEALRKLPAFKSKEKEDGTLEHIIEDTNDKTLSKFVRYEKDKPVALKPAYQVIVDLINYRTTEKALSSFGENIVDLINPITKRLHSNHDQLGAVTGRMSSSKPNLQNIPKLKEYRACFIAEPGNKIGTLDFDGCEVRIMTEASGDPVWIEALNKGWDIHSVVAEKMRHDEWIKATAQACAFVAAHSKCECPEHKNIRGESKSINFGLAYGLTALGLADQLNITEERAQALLNLWHASNPVLSRALMLWGDLAKATFEARDLAGRRRSFKKVTWEWATELVTERNKKFREGAPATNGQIKWKYKTLLESVAREGCNHRIQGTNATATKLSMGCGFDENGKPFFWHYSRPDKAQCLLCNLVHDEAVIESPEAKIEEAFGEAKDCMIRALSRYVKKVPVLVDGHIAYHWMK